MASLTRIALVTLSLLLAPATAQATTTILSLDHQPSLGPAGTAGNTVILTDIGTNAHVTSIAYSLSLDAAEPGFLSDMHAWFGSSDKVWAKFNPGFERAEEGTAAYDGIVDLVAADMDFFVNDDGLLKLELIDAFNDTTTPNGFWTGTFTITSDDIATDGAVPEPATWAMMIAGFGVVGASLRRRRSVTPMVAQI